MLGSGCVTKGIIDPGLLLLVFRRQLKLLMLLMLLLRIDILRGMRLLLSLLIDNSCQLGKPDRG